ncbi:MAG: FtsH protease activity modulator HflK [Deltaproteobacteria bacterium]|jgi:membrane protease subunit HflK|nr:FtsH protease activity modulator HflK [Deltaproteobacteria bacterium]
MDWEEWQKSRKKRSSPPRNGGNGGGGGGPLFSGNLGGWLKRFDRFGGRLSTIWFVAVFLAVWLASGFFTVEPYERGLVKLFGRYSRQVEQGLRYHWPWPIESVIKVNYTQTRQFDLGGAGSRGLEEATMLTGDENIVNIQFMVLYKVDDPVAYAFNVFDPEKAIRDAAVSAMREVIGRNSIDGALTENRGHIQEDTKATLQAMMDKYATGLTVDNVELQDVHVPADVIQAFKDVTSAREDSERSVNEATGYRNNVIPEAEARAYAMVAQAQAYKAERVNRAQGEAARFLQLLAEYRKAPQVTRERLQLEAMDAVLGSVDKYVMGGDAGRGVLPILPLSAPPSPSGDAQPQQGGDR